MKYLIIECRELGDQWECDADRNPICVTDNYEKYNKRGYEIYEIKEDGFFLKIKDYETSSRQGIAIYSWKNEEDVGCRVPDEIFTDWEGYGRKDINKRDIAEFREAFSIEGSVKEIYKSLQNSGSYAEDVYGEWIVIGEYVDDDYSVGF